MSSLLPWLVAGLPLVAASGLGFVRSAAAGWAALATTLATLMLALALPAHTRADIMFRVDPLSAHLAILAAAAGLLAAWNGRATTTGPRAAVALAVLGGIELAALANNMLLGWIGLEVALLGLLLGTRPRGEALWRALLTMLFALALSLMGVLFLYHAGVPAIGSGAEAMRWDQLALAAPKLSAGLLSLGIVLGLAGLACCAGLAPLHAWQRVAGRGNAMAAAMVPALGAVALGLVLRARAISAAHDGALEPGPALLAFGLASLGWAALGLWRQRAAPLSASLFHAGMAATAFGLEAAAADAAGLMLLTVAVLMAPLAAIGGRGSALLLAALAMLPPFATFGAGLAVLGAAADALPWLAPLLAALMAAGAAGLARAALFAWQLPSGPRTLEAPRLMLVALAVLAGMAPPAARWFEMVAGGLR